MSVQTITLGDRPNINFIEEFLSDYCEAQAEIENALLSLENNPDNSELLNHLFRNVHSIKGNSHFLGLHVMTDLIHSLEAVLQKLRNRDISYSSALGDTVLKVVDQIGNLVRCAQSNQQSNLELVQAIQEDLKNFTTEYDATATDNSDKYNPYSDVLKSNQQNSSIENSCLDVHTSKEEDLKLFARLINRAEQRSPLWEGRSTAVLKIALDLNREAGNKVDPQQLEAAVYLHDLGMVYLPLETIDRNEPLTNNDHQSLRLHPNMGASIIADKPQWQEAKKMILQHHEREDGQGYPGRLTGRQICDGAKILAIASTIESIISRRDGNNSKYPVSYAIREINKNQGNQFSPYWVSIFNRVIRGHTDIEN